MSVIQFQRKSARGPSDDSVDCIAAEYQQAGMLSTLPQRIYEEVCFHADIKYTDLSELTEEEFANCKRAIDDILSRQYASGIIKQKVELSR